MAGRFSVACAAQAGHQKTAGCSIPENWHPQCSNPDKSRLQEEFIFMKQPKTGCFLSRKLTISFVVLLLYLVNDLETIYKVNAHSYCATVIPKPSKHRHAGHTSSGTRKYLIVLPLMYVSGILQNLSPSCLCDTTYCLHLLSVLRMQTMPLTLKTLTFDVQITSRRWTFIQLSHCTMCPLYVSPFFSSTSCTE